MTASLYMSDHRSYTPCMLRNIVGEAILACYVLASLEKCSLEYVNLQADFRSNMFISIS